MSARVHGTARRGVRIAAAAWLFAIAAGGAFVAGDDSCLPDEQRREMQAAVADNVARLLAEGTLPRATEGAVLFDLPLRDASDLPDPGYFTRTAFVDHDPWVGSVLDYNCGSRSRDGPGGGHLGTDFFIWPYPWLKMENEDVEIVAAAAGTVVFKQDGLYDKHCNCETSSSNQVAVRHSDGSITWYLHMKNGSLTSKGIGAGVAAGEYLGLVGSSGCSSIPHLHFEVYDGGNNLIDPYAGPCNDLNVESRWLSQRPYFDSAVNKIVIGTVTPYTPPGCAAIEQPNESYSIAGGDTIYFTTYTREPREGQVVTSTLITPDDTIHESWSYTYTGNWSVNTRSISTVLPAATDGTWRFRVEFEGQTHERQFVMNPAGAGRISPTLALGRPTLDGLPLTWGDSCNPADTGYAVYVGHMGNWYHHGPSTCDLVDRSYSVPLHQVSGDRYYLVVPRRNDVEGSHGLSSNGTERPRGVLPCFGEHSVECP